VKSNGKTGRSSGGGATEPEDQTGANYGTTTTGFKQRDNKSSHSGQQDAHAELVLLTGALHEGPSHSNCRDKRGKHL